MTFAELRSFAATVRRGGFSAAARALGLSQSAVSRHVQRLEREFGVALLERGARVATPTRAGLVVAAFAERVLSDAERARREATAAAAAALTLEVASSSAPAAALVPALLAEFARAAGGGRARLHLMDSAAVEACVLARHCDVGFLGRPPEAGRLHWRVVARERVVLAVPCGHPFAARGAVPLGDLAGQVLIRREEGSGTRYTVEEALGRAGRELPPAARILTAEGGADLLSQVNAGRGLGFASAAVCAAEGGVVAVEIADVDFRRELLMVHDPRRVDRSPALGAFLAFVAARPG